jgi:subtilisin family serine protease
MSVIRVGLIDSGIAPESMPRVDAMLAFALARDPADSNFTVERGPLTPDVLGHGSAVSRRIADFAPNVRWHVAQVFDASGRTSALQLAAALDWLARQGVALICMSLGVRADRPSLARACADAVDRGIAVCASAPARGASVFPAAYPGMVRVTGDARCAPDQWSWLGTAQADFGAAARPQPGGPAGASLANAAFCGILAACMARHHDFNAAQSLQYLRQSAPLQGRQLIPSSSARSF